VSDSDESSAVDRALRRAGELDEDPHPEEPDEFDPHSLGPESTDPTATNADIEVDGETFRAFWSAVVLANLGLFAVALGLMLAYFRAQLLVGGALVVAGAGALGHTYRIHRDYTGGASA
jgi:hypothetical protein